jgi:RND family efflux transporter MFP subunit
MGAVADEEHLANELASLRIDRDRKKKGAAKSAGGRRGVPGWLVALLLLPVLGVGGWFVMREGRGRMFPDEVEIGTVALMSPQPEDVKLVASGYVYARRKATLAPKIAGRVAKLLVDETATVKEGQLVAELEATDALAALSQVRADIAAGRARAERARADVADAQTRFDREDALLKRGAGTQAAFDDAKARLAQARAQLGAVEAEVHATEARREAAQVQLDNTRLRAPFAGTIVRKLAEVGDVVTPSGATGVFTIASLDDLEVQADVSEAQFSKVRPATPTEVLLDAFPDRRFRGTVSEIRPSVDRAKASVTVKVRFSDPTEGVLPDMAAKVSFLSKALDAAALKAAPKLVAPADAVVTRDGKRVLFTVEDGRARSLEVAPGKTYGTSVELTGASPPTAGTRVVRNPSPDLRDGFPIKEKKR